jgi:uncharacterized protein (TIGR02001 family)
MRNTILTLTTLILAIGSASVRAEDSPHQFSGNIGLFTDYLYRGISQTSEKAAVQGGMDYSHATSGFYVGTWASNVDFAEDLEIDVYGGLSGELDGGLSWDVGGLYYIYPSSDAQPEENFFEVYASTGYTFPGALEPSVGIGIAYSPDFFGEDGDGVYINGSLDLSLPHGFGLSFYVGHQDVEGDQTTGPEGFNYTHYSIGISKSLGPLSLSASWNDADDDCGGEICEALVGSISMSF